MKKVYLILSLFGLLVLASCGSNNSLKRLDTPENLQFNEDTLTFDKVSHATLYLIIGGDFSETTNTNSYTFEEGSYKVRVVAKAEGYLDSLHSAEISFVVGPDETPDPETRLDTPQNLLFDKDTNTLTFDVVPNATSYHITGSGIDETVTTGSYTFTTYGYYVIDVVAKAKGFADSLRSNEIEVIVITPDAQPFMTTSRNIVSNLKDDTKLSFKSVGYSFESLTGFEITANDYTYQDDLLTIKASYLKSYFETNSSKSELILTYIFSKENQTFIGFITIKK